MFFLHKGLLVSVLREDRTETRLMLSLPAAKPHSRHKRSLGTILRQEIARLMLSLPVCSLGAAVTVGCCVVVVRAGSSRSRELPLTFEFVLQ